MTSYNPTGGPNIKKDSQNLDFLTKSTKNTTKIA